MDVDLTIRYPEERLCEIIASRPDTAAPLYRIAPAPHRPRREPHRDNAGSTPPSMKSPHGRIAGGNDAKQQTRVFDRADRVV